MKLSFSCLRRSILIEHIANAWGDLLVLLIVFWKIDKLTLLNIKLMNTLIKINYSLSTFMHSQCALSEPISSSRKTRKLTVCRFIYTSIYFWRIGTSRTVDSAKKFVWITSGFGGGEFTKTLRKVCTCQKLKFSLGPCRLPLSITATVHY
jgi:hypothetical protein